MAKKLDIDDVEFNEDDNFDSEKCESNIDDIDDDISGGLSSDIVISEDDDDKIDIIIEISEDDEVSEIDITIDVDLDDGVPEDVVLSKHKLHGKHSLKYDSIFKGKKDDVAEDESTSSHFNDKFEVDKGSILYTESHDNENYLRQKKVKERVYEVLSTCTNLNFMNNRRKPSRVDFNDYYELLMDNLIVEKFTNVELFNELSVYFSDNLFNMFKLLDNKYRNLIISELQDHIGKNDNSKEITNRNIYLGTELEFQHEDILGEYKLYTGVVIEVDYQTSYFKIDSYENIYNVNILNITKILNNTKFKHNLNKLDNIDFL